MARVLNGEFLELDPLILRKLVRKAGHITSRSRAIRMDAVPSDRQLLRDYFPEKADVVCQFPQKITNNHWEDYVLNHSGYCVVTVSKPAGPDGVQLKCRAHHLAWFEAQVWSRGLSILSLARAVPNIVHLAPLVKDLSVRGQTFSHLCHNSWCVEPAHIVLEPHWVNIARMNCRPELDGVCNCHWGRSSEQGAGVKDTYQCCVYFSNLSRVHLGLTQSSSYY